MSGELRHRLETILDSEAFTIYCYDHFQAVYPRFQADQNPSQRVQTLAAYVEQTQQVKALEEHLAALDPIQQEQRYRQRLKARYAADAPYYIPLAGETTEVVSTLAVNAPRSQQRRRQRAEADYHEWIQAGQEIKRVKLKTLREGVDKYPCLILLGEPGSGKTTALENLAYQFATETEWLPVPLHLSRFEAGMTVEDFIQSEWGGSEAQGNWGVPLLAKRLDEFLEQGRLFFLFDALNEMPQEGYSERVQALRQFIDSGSKKGNKFLVTCRVLDYGETLAGLQRVEVQPLTEAQIKTFVQKELPEDWSALWQQLEADQQQLLDLARNPYNLTMMIDIFVEEKKLGHNRTQLMAQFATTLMSWAKTKYRDEAGRLSADWLELEIQQAALSETAYQMQAQGGFGTQMQVEQVKATMPQQVGLEPERPPIATPPGQILNLAASANLIEMPVDRSSVRFYHQLLQEYFAACQMLKQDPNSLTELWRWPWWLEADMPLWVRPEGNVDPLPPPPTTGWEETTIMAAGLAIENDDQLIQALIQVNPVLAGRCLHVGQAKVDAAVYQQVIAALLKTIAQPEVALRVRIAAGQVLGYLGDPRLGEMVTIPAGEFVMGDDKYGPAHTLFLPEYQLGKYPVTNEEFDRFVEAGGYQERRWWTEAGWEEKEDRSWREPRYRQEAQFNQPNQPVVGVSWYECVAYCRWLSTETGSLYRLLTEAEWEKGAGGTDGRVYPWGNVFEADRLNADEGDQPVRTTTPVGIYPAGVSPFGAYDCAGNVKEWCATQMGQFYPYDASEDEWMIYYPDRSNTRALRSGSWDLNRDSSRCASRRGSYPGYSNDTIGFRVVSPSC